MLATDDEQLFRLTRIGLLLSPRAAAADAGHATAERAETQHSA
jgi:hypothetical protein